MTGPRRDSQPRRSRPAATPRRPRTDRLIALFLFGLVAFNPPLLRIFDAPVTVFGLPLLYVYIFAIWAVVILLLALSVEGGERER